MERGSDRLIEVLAPAGSMEGMRAAVAAGADAVYMGGSRFGARAYADNPEQDQMLEAIDYVHLHDRRIYMTVNTLVKDRELGDLIPFLAPYYEAGLDAVLVQDLGVLKLIRENFPDLPVHASTQMSVTSPEYARLLAGEGVTRIVPARELSMEEIRALTATGLEIECFVHGALCFCYSGQCLFSSLIGGRSGNRGRCAQTCRLPFTAGSRYAGENGQVQGAGGRRPGETYQTPLSMKDLSSLDVLPELLDAGVTSLKIEGRMKSPEYAAGVVSIYRHYVDLWRAEGTSGYRVSPEDRRHLLDLFDRGGQTDGYLHRHNGPEMIIADHVETYGKSDLQYRDALQKKYLEKPLQEPVDIRVMARTGQPLEAEFVWKPGHRYGGLPDAGEACRVTVQGDIPGKARSRSASALDIEKQMRGLGQTSFTADQVRIDLEDGLFLPVSALKSLRRSGAEQLRERILRRWRRTPSEKGENTDIGAIPLAGKGRDTVSARTVHRKGSAAGEAAENDRWRLSVSVEMEDQLEAALDQPSAARIDLDSGLFPPQGWEAAVLACHRRGKRCMLRLPRIWRREAVQYFICHEKELAQADFDGAVLQAADEIVWAGKHFAGRQLILDASVYTMNRQARLELEHLLEGSQAGEVMFRLPVELNRHELGERGCAGDELMVYGRIPVMVTAQCLLKNTDRCRKKSGLTQLTDRKNKTFPVRQICAFCTNVVYNADPLSLIGERAQIERLSPAWLHIAMTTETGKDTAAIISAFAAAFLENGGSKTAALPGIPGEGHTTRGHFRRGVE